MLTVAVSVAKFTSAVATPGTRLRAFSTRVAHEAQVMPSMGSLMMLEVFMATLSTLTQWESQALDSPIMGRKNLAAYPTFGCNGDNHVSVQCRRHDVRPLREQRNEGR